jgi:hypothetical protein
MTPRTYSQPETYPNRNLEISFYVSDLVGNDNMKNRFQKTPKIIVYDKIHIIKLEIWQIFWLQGLIRI